MLLGAKLLMSTSFHPQMNGQTECMNQNIGQIFCVTIQYDQKNWVDKCLLVKFAINLTILSTTKFAPFELNYGYLPLIIHNI